MTIPGFTSEKYIGADTFALRKECTNRNLSAEGPHEALEARLMLADEMDPVNVWKREEEIKARQKAKEDFLWQVSNLPELQSPGTVFTLNGEEILLNVGYKIRINLEPNVLYVVWWNPSYTNNDDESVTSPSLNGAIELALIEIGGRVPISKFVPGGSP